MIMDTNTIKQKIDALNAMVAADSVTPETVASILYDLLAALEDVTLPDNVVTDDDITDVLRTGDVRDSLLGGETDKPVSVALVQKLAGSGYRFMGIAGTATAPYSTPEAIGLKLFYLAVEQGTYSKFGNKVKKSAASIMALCSSDSGATWTAEESADLASGDLQDRVSIGKTAVWIGKAVASEPHDPSQDTIGEILLFKEGMYLKEVVRSSTGGKALGGRVDLEQDRLYVYNGQLCKWDGESLVPVVKSDSRNVYDWNKFSLLNEESGIDEIAGALTTADGKTETVPQVGDLLEGSDGRSSPSRSPTLHCYPVVLSSEWTATQSDIRRYVVGWLQGDGIHPVGLAYSENDLAWAVESVEVKEFGGIVEGEFELVAEEI